MQTIEELKKERAKHKPGSKEYGKYSVKISKLNKKLGNKKLKKENPFKPKPFPEIPIGKVKAIEHLFSKAFELYLHGEKDEAFALLEILK